MNPGDYRINILESSFRDDYLNTISGQVFDFTINALPPIMNDLPTITNSVLLHSITLSDKISFVPFVYSDLIIDAVSTNEYVNTIENLDDGINITFNQSIQNISRLDNTSFTIPIEFTVSNGNNSTTFNKNLTVTNVYTPPVFQTITITPEIVKQTGQQITLAVEHRDTSYENLSIESASFTASSNYIGSITSLLQSVSTNQSNIILSFTLDQLDFGTKTLDITLKDNEQDYAVTENLQIILSSPYVNVDYSQSLQNIVEFKQVNDDYLLSYKRKQTSEDVLQDSIIEIFNINANDTVYMKILDSYYQLKKEYDANSKLYFTLFNFVTESDRDTFITEVSNRNTKSKEYNAQLEVRNSSDEKIFETKPFDITLKQQIQASGSDGYIGNASLYLVNNSFDKISNANGLNNLAIGGTDGAGKLSTIDYSSYSNINLNDTSIKYYLSLEGGIDIATGLSNNFIMYKHVTNTNPFIVSYLTTLDAYIQESSSSSINSLNVKTMFGLDESINIETYDPIGSLITNTSGQVTSAETAYKENMYISILVSELLIAGKSQSLIMDTVLTQYVNHNASSFSDTLFLESVVDTIYPSPNEQTNFKINIGILFATMDSLITNDQYSGSTLATEITKVKASVGGLDLFSELDSAAINAQIASSVIGILGSTSVYYGSNSS